jgi:hypothetical protein
MCSTPDNDILESMDAYAKIDHGTLARNLNAVCSVLGGVVNGIRPFGAPPALTGGDTADVIPVALYDIAVKAGWINEQEDLEEREWESRKDADLFGGTLHFTVSFNEWFLGLVADTLAKLEVVAENNREAQQKHNDMLTEMFRLSFLGGSRSDEPRADGTDNPAGRKIDEFFAKSRTVINIQTLVDEATKRKGDPVTRSSVSRIYNGFGAGGATRELVASIINELVPCTRDDLRATKKKPTKK